jgi:Lar family restriction alleviation protein
MTELKPCPFCGGKATLRSDFGYKEGCQTAWVRCTCGADGPISDSCAGETETEAIAAWNRRVEGAK